MLCQICKNKTAVCTRQVKTEIGAVVELNLCAECASTIGNEIGEFDSKLKSNLPKKVTVTCDACKTGLDDFLETNYVGCSDCYAAFEEEMERVVFAIHGATKHCGKVPEMQIKKANRLAELKSLSKELEVAISKEEFILADKLKNRIANLKRES